MSEERNRHNRVSLGTEPEQHVPPTRNYILLAIYGSVFCERFCFFLLISVLVLFLHERCGYSSALAVRWYGMFVSGCYLTSILGGRLCDGKMGANRVSFLGLVIQAVGFVLLTMETPNLTLIILLFIALGAGLFKAGTQTLLGSLPLHPASVRERAFGVIYVIVNIAGLLAPLIGGAVQTMTGYRPLFVMLVGSALLGSTCLLPTLAHRPTHSYPVQVQLPAVQPTSPRAVLALILASGMLFAAAFVQSHSTLLLFVRDHIDRQLGRFTIPVAWFGAAPGAMVLLISPVAALAFSVLRKRNREPSTLRKVAIGMVITALAFLPIWGAVRAAHGGHLVSPLWVLACIAMLSLGELLVGAHAPAEISRIAPPSHTGRWMSYWFLATAIGNIVGGWVEW